MNTLDFVQNRRKLLAKLPKGSLVLLSANSQMQRGIDSAYRFEQESNFYYLSGIEAADWLLVIDKDSQKEFLVEPDISEVHRIFDGALPAEVAKQMSGVGEVVDAKSGAKEVKELIAKSKEIFTLLPQPTKYFNFIINPAQTKMIKKFGLKNAKDIRTLLAKIRAIKSDTEIQQIKKAVDITVASLQRVEKNIGRFTSEAEIDGLITYEFRKRQANHGYDPIVAGGINACTLHYIDNNKPLNGAKFVLIDVGAKQAGYSADITRTYRLTAADEDMKVYDAVKRVHDYAVSLCSSGRLVREYVELTDKKMHEELISLNLVKGKDIAEIRQYFPHAISHGLGLDVHDSLGGSKKLEAGMVLTVEPGIYIPERQIGIRIENDILVSKEGPVNLSAGLAY